MSATRYYITTIILIFSIALWGCEDNGLPEQNNGPISLQFNFIKDSSYQYILDSKMTLEPVVNGKTLTITQQMKLLSTYVVTSSSGDNKNVAVTYNRITMSSSNGVTTNEYDSEDTINQNPVFASLGAMMKRTFNISFSKNGIAGVQNLYDEEQLNDSSAISYGDSSLRKAMLQFLTMYPTQAIKPGDTWKREFLTSNGPIHMRLVNTYTLKSIDGDIAHIALEGQISAEDSTQSPNFIGIQSGAIDVDIKTGLITIGQISQHLNGKIKLAGKVTEASATSEINLIGNKL